MAFWEAYEKPRQVDLDLPAPTSSGWFARTVDERLSVLREAVVDALSA